MTVRKAVATTVVSLAAIQLVYVGLFVPAKRAREQSRLIGASSHLAKIELALKAYAADHGELPRIGSAVSGQEPRISWRESVLPYMEPDVPPGTVHPSRYFHSLRDSSTREWTSYVGVALRNDPGINEVADIGDGRVNIVVEVPHSGIVWNEPRDFTQSEFLEWIGRESHSEKTILLLVVGHGIVRLEENSLRISRRRSQLLEMWLDAAVSGAFGDARFIE